MEYIKVANPDKKYDSISVAVAKKTLASISIFGRKFGATNISHQARKQPLVDYRKVVKDKNAELYFDSGGYSIIKGDIQFGNMEEFQDYYFYIMETERHYYDYIFSLDIPWGMEDERLRDRDVLLNANYRIMHKTIKLMKKHPMLINKLIFVHHFKMMDQYDIWQKLYKELELGKHIIHRAIGGMVSLRKLRGGADFSPFLPMIFRVFQDFLDSGRETPLLKIHILGVYTFCDRFAIAMAEALLNLYLEENNIKTEAVLSYDTTYYANAARIRFKTMPFWDFDGGALSRYSYHNIPNYVLQEVYGTGQILLDVYDEIDNANNNRRLNDINAFVPLSVYSEIELDVMAEYMVHEYDILDRIDTGGKLKRLGDGKINGLLNNMEMDFKPYKDEFFSKHKKKTIANNLIILSLMRQHLFHDRISDIESFVRRFIRLIDFPYYLM